MKEHVLLVNQIYHNVNKKFEAITSMLRQAGYDIEFGLFSGYYVKVDDTYIEEEYPIPIITVNDLIEIGVDLTSVFLELKMTKELALNITYDFERDFVLYGLEDSLDDVYNSKRDSGSVYDKINNSYEESFGLAFSFNYEEEIDNILVVIEKLLNL